MVGISRAQKFQSAQIETLSSTLPSTGILDPKLSAAKRAEQIHLAMKALRPHMKDTDFRVMAANTIRSYLKESSD